MQLDWNLSLSGEDYVITQAWRDAKLDCCPAHPGAGCGFAGHGTYRRKTRWGDAPVPRWYCPDAHMTWSLLARCFAARLPGTLDDLEAAALAAGLLGAVASTRSTVVLSVPVRLAWSWLVRRG